MVSKKKMSPRVSDSVKDQLRLFAFEAGAALPSEALRRLQKGLSKRERLAILLEGELNFHGANTHYASHNMHSFAAKFPPQLPRAFIRGLTSQGDVVLDPMMGSGTTIVEAMLEGRNAIGLDIDPLALRLADVKTTPVEAEDVWGSGNRVITRAWKHIANGNTVSQNLAERFDEKTREFVDYWFLPNTQRELMALILAIEELPDSATRRFLELTFSSIAVSCASS